MRHNLMYKYTTTKKNREHTSQHGELFYQLHTALKDKFLY